MEIFQHYLHVPSTCRKKIRPFKSTMPLDETRHNFSGKRIETAVMKNKEAKLLFAECEYPGILYLFGQVDRF